ncbi:hypothetical protein KS4_31910 [Poriferisphaera corsica]|uniref:SnoaL-like domain-containing protein n=1 Tax=Poriferisphaera corsica TaxID=2528020 RepID=A0A517YY14_9BACT|nr:nuclear transport factor 2 family protein [Poriferisphaera corsica]QDU35111.1 hypothetical protein KS4_31910 [Poriferisphaera corsica]
MPATSTLDLGNQLADLCKEGRHLEAVDTLYDENIVSIEPCSSPDMPARMEGIQAVRGKNEWWLNAFEMKDQHVYGPYPHGERFALAFCMDVVNKETKEEMHMEEVALYTVKDNKIVQEEFFHVVPGTDQ